MRIHTEGLPLFPAHNGTVTSQEAAERVASHVSDQQLRILGALHHEGSMTRSEIAAFTGLRENSVNGRCFELSHDAPGHTPFIVGCGRREGREVLELTPAGLDAVRGAA